jgi:hypothetical protein
MKIFPHAEQFASLHHRLRRARMMIAECYSSLQVLIGGDGYGGRVSCTERVSMRML